MPLNWSDLAHSKITIWVSWSTSSVVLIHSSVSIAIEEQTASIPHTVYTCADILSLTTVFCPLLIVL